MKYSEDLKTLSSNPSLKSISNTLKHNSNLKQSIYDFTKFISHDAPIGERLWYIKNEIYEQASCVICKKPTKIDYRNDIIKCCSFSCTVKIVNPETGLTKAQEISLKTKAKLNKVDSETGLTGYQKSGIKSKESNSKIDLETGMTGYQKSGIKSKESNSRVDSETGMTGYQTSSVKSRAKLNEVDSETGLTGYQKLGINSKAGNSKVDSETGLTGYQVAGINTSKTLKTVQESGLTRAQEIGIKASETMRTIDPETGLSIYELGEIRRIETMSEVDPETGLTKFELSGLKTNITRSKINEETGLNSYYAGALKASETMQVINPETGLSIYQEIAIKSDITKSIIDPETGLSIYDRNAIQWIETMSKVDPETGLTKIALREIKTKITRSKINKETGLNSYHDSALKASETMQVINPETGLTKAQEAGLKGSITKLENGFNNILNNFPHDKYAILTTKFDYISTTSRLISYSCNKCNSIRDSYWPYIRCTTCYPYTKSIAEHEVFEYCQTLVDIVESNTRQVISPLEIDIYIPEYKLAIEYNGLYWHSSNSVETENKEYHLTKTILCQEKGIQLLHIFENEWVDPIKQNIWKSIIRNKLGKSDRIYGRKTEIRIVDDKTKTIFLNNNHLQGTCASSVNIGLYHQDVLVALMTFGKSRYDKQMDWELLRYCNVIDSSVLGGASKLLKYFMMDYKGSIISYADRRRSDGNLYDKLGFELSHETSPNYWYWKNSGLESRIKYQKHKLEKILEIYNKEFTESINMYNNNYRKLYDCGNFVFKLNKR